jgi:hypothetical protein
MPLFNFGGNNDRRNRDERGRGDGNRDDNRDDDNDNDEVMTDQEKNSVKAKHVILTTLKWAAIGAAVVGLLAAALPAVLGVSAFTHLPWWGQLIGGGAIMSGQTFGLGGMLGSTMMSLGIKGAMIGGVAAGAYGLFNGLNGMDAKAQDEEEDRRANRDRIEQRQQRRRAITMERRRSDVNMSRMEQEYNLPRYQGQQGGRGPEIGRAG